MAHVLRNRTALILESHLFGKFAWTGPPMRVLTAIPYSPPCQNLFDHDCNPLAGDNIPSIALHSGLPFRIPRAAEVKQPNSHVNSSSWLATSLRGWMFAGVRECVIAKY